MFSCNKFVCIANRNTLFTLFLIIWGRQVIPGHSLGNAKTIWIFSALLIKFSQDKKHWSHNFVNTCPVMAVSHELIFPCTNVCDMYHKVRRAWASFHWIHWGWDKMADIFQKTFSNAFSWMQMLIFRLHFDWSLYLMPPLNSNHDISMISKFF